MIKKFFSIAMVAVSLIAIPATAQDTSSAACKTSKISASSQCVQKTGDIKDCVAKREAFEFNGMKLSETQKKQLSDLKSRTRAEKKQRSDAYKAERKQKKEAAKADRRKVQERQMQDKRSYLKEVKKIVGDENYVIFLENQYVMSSDGRGHKAGMRGDKKAHKDFKGHKDRKNRNHSDKDRKNREGKMARHSASDNRSV